MMNQNLADHTPMMQQYLNIKAGYPNALVLYRMGDFYELFFDDAKIANQILGITLTKRGMDKQGNIIAMAGVPFHSADSYIARLIGAGQTVVICEQVAEEDGQAVNEKNDKNKKSTTPKIMERKVVRTLTAGTLTDDNLIYQGQTPTVVALHFAKTQMAVGIAELNLAKGTIKACEITAENLEKLKSELKNTLVRFDPSEILIDEQLSEAWQHCLQDCLIQQTPIVIQAHSLFLADNAKEHLCQHFEVQTLAGFGLGEKSLATASCSVVLHYGKQTQQSALTHIKTISLENGQDYLQLDSISQQNLEIFKPVLATGISLLSVIDNCQTAMGKRALAYLLHRPLLDKTLINQRLDVVSLLAELPEESFLLLCQSLQQIADIERIGGRIGLNSAKPSDLTKLRESLNQSLILNKQLQHLLAQYTSPLLSTIMANLPKIDTKDVFANLYQILNNAIVDEPPSHTRDGGMIRIGYHNELDNLRTLHENIEQMLETLADEERTEHNLPTLKVGFNKVSGFYFELSSLQSKNAPPHFSRRQTLKNAERYITPKLKQLEDAYLSAQSQIIQLEKQLYDELLSNLQTHLSDLQKLSQAVADIDVFCNWVTLTKPNPQNWCRPTFGKNADPNTAYIDIKAGRHLVVAHANQKDIDNFVANDCQISTPNQPETLMLITGPNMGGKSTYMRQTALILLLAHCGGFVPAQTADFGKIERIFTRIGSADDLASGKSTFMVEMIETANIMNQANAYSLVLMDEVGRGTSTQDGLAIAHACVQYLTEKIGCLTLFATHYFELTEFANKHPKMFNQHLVTQEIDGKLLLLHKIAKGSTHRSFGLHVAKMAGVPNDILHNAQQFLQNLPKPTDKNVNHSQLNLNETPKQIDDLFSIAEKQQNEENQQIINKIKQISADDLTPKQALEFIYSLKELLNDK